MENYNNYNNYNKLSGKYSFNIFLDIITEIDNFFIADDYLNYNDFTFLFKTDKIVKKDKLLIILKRYNSLLKSYNVLFENKQRSLSFYFSVKKYKLEYGYYDLKSNLLYKTGEFNITSNYLKTIKSKSLRYINNIIKNVNLMKSNRLHSILYEYKKFLNGYGKIEFLDFNRVINRFDKKYFKKEDIDIQRLEYTINNWALKFPWHKYFYFYANISDTVDFYIKIK